MKSLLTILSLIFLIPLGYSQEINLSNLKSSRIYIPKLASDFKSLAERQKRYYFRQWEVIADSYEGKELLIRYFDPEISAMVSKKLEITRDIERRRSVIKLILSSVGNTDEIPEIIDIHSVRLQTAVIYIINGNSRIM